MEWKDAKQQLLQSKSRRKAYKKVDLGYEIGKMIIDGRIATNMTQSKLANLVGTKQPSIARIEKGSYLPSLTFLQRIAEAFGTQLLPPRLELLENLELAHSIHSTINRIEPPYSFPILNNVPMAWSYSHPTPKNSMKGELAHV